MERSKAEAVIEAILFTMGDSVEISRLAEVIEEDVKTTKSILKDMAARYEEENRGIGLTQFDDSVQLCTKTDMYEYLIKIAICTFGFHLIIFIFIDTLFFRSLNKIFNIISDG